MTLVSKKILQKAATRTVSEFLSTLIEEPLTEKVAIFRKKKLNAIRRSINEIEAIITTDKLKGMTVVEVAQLVSKQTNLIVDKISQLSAQMDTMAEEE